MPTTKKVRHIQINVWLGVQQRIEILADRKVEDIHACKDKMTYTRSDNTTVSDVPHLVRELGDKLANALAADAFTVEICVEDDKKKIVACQ